jgi:ankyrin repeat protein
MLGSGCVSETGIHAAAQTGNNGAVSEFIAKDKASVNAKNTSGKNPLHLAAANGHTTTVELLIDNGAGIDNKDGYGNTPLVYAASSGSSATVNTLLINHAAASSPAFSAASRNNAADAKAILAAANGITPLHYAIINNQPEDVIKCINKKWQVDAKDIDGVTPLHYAVKNNNTAMINLLIEHKANINAVDNDGMTPLHYAAIFSANPICDLLIAKGASKTARSNSGMTAGEVAVNAGKIDSLKSLKP